MYVISHTGLYSQSGSLHLSLPRLAPCISLFPSSRLSSPPFLPRTSFSFSPFTRYDGAIPCANVSSNFTYSHSNAVGAEVEARTVAATAPITNNNNNSNNAVAAATDRGIQQPARCFKYAKKRRINPLRCIVLAVVCMWRPCRSEDEGPHSPVVRAIFPHAARNNAKQRVLTHRMRVLSSLARPPPSPPVSPVSRYACKYSGTCNFLGGVQDTREDRWLPHPILADMPMVDQYLNSVFWAVSVTTGLGYVEKGRDRR